MPGIWIYHFFYDKKKNINKQTKDKEEDKKKMITKKKKIMTKRRKWRRGQLWQWLQKEVEEVNGNNEENTK